MRFSVLRKKEQPNGCSFAVSYLMRRIHESVVPPTVAVAVVMPALTGVIRPSAEIVAMPAFSVAQVTLASVPVTISRIDSLSLTVQSY